MPETDVTGIDLLILDVDGVLTDGRVILSPTGEETKSFHVHDGAGMKYWKRSGKKLAIVTGRSSPAVQLRAEELDVDVVRLNVKDKLPVVKEVISSLSTTAERTAAIGDDLTDLPVLRHVAFGAVVADATEEVRQVADYIAQKPGGAGAVREIIELLLKKAGLWENILARYLPRN